LVTTHKYSRKNPGVLLYTHTSMNKENHYESPRIILESLYITSGILEESKPTETGEPIDEYDIFKP